MEDGMNGIDRINGIERGGDRGTIDEEMATNAMRVGVDSPPLAA
jgi:hypothetical protein